MEKSLRSLINFQKRSEILVSAILSIIINYLWYRGVPIYGGDQGFLIAGGINPSYIVNPVIYAFTNYPYGFVTIASTTSWVNLILLPFTIFSNLGEEVFSTVLSILGSYYVIMIVQKYYGKSILMYFLSAFLYLTNWFIFIGFVEMPYIFLNITLAYFLLPVIVYYSLLYAKGKVKFTRAYPIITTLSSYLLFTSGEVFPILWLGLFVIIGYYLRKKILQFFLIVISFTIPQFYWVFSFASSILPHYSNITNSSLKLVTSLSSSPLLYSASTYLSSVIPVHENLIFLAFMGFLSVLSFLFTKGDLKFLSLLWLIVLGFDSSQYTPWSSIVTYAVAHYAFFAVLRTVQFATAPFGGFLFSLIIPSLIRGKYSKEIFLLLLVSFSILNLPIITGALADRVYTPSYFINLINYLNSQEGHFSIAVFPTVEYGWYSTTWYYGNPIYLYYSKHPVITGGIYSGAYFYNYYFRLNFLLYNFNSSDRNFVTYIENLLLVLNVKYIIIEGDAHSNIFFVYPEYLPIQPYLKNLNFLEEKYHLVTFIKQFGPLYLYKVNLHTSYVYYTNTSNLNITKDNLSELLFPAPIEYKSPVMLQVPQSNSKFVLLTYVYSPYWDSNNTPPLNVSGFNLYQTFGKGITIYDSLQNQLIRYDLLGFISMSFPTLLSLLFILIKKMLRKRKIYK